MPTLSPLRYPGGKRRLTDSVMQLLDENQLQDIQYAEPFAGGAAIGLALLFGEYASVIHLNDLSRPVYAFWHTAIHENGWLCRRLERTRVTMRVWKAQRQVYETRSRSHLRDLGFATLFLNRCNRSGIIGGGVIGGQQQNGEWDITARFGKEELVDRLRRIGRYASRIRLYQMDARAFTDQVVPKLGRRAFAFIDPPYIEKGKDLYLNTYQVADHQRLSSRIMRLRQPWAVTYDFAAIKHGLYSGCRRVVYDLRYVANDRYAGREVMFVSPSIQLPTLERLLGPCMHVVRHQCRLKTA